MSGYDTNTIVNSLYDGAIVSAFTIGYGMIAKKLLKTKTPSLEKFDVYDTAKLTGLIAASTVTRDMLVSKGYIPDKIMK